MSSNGNRSQPNHVRVQGQQDEHDNRSNTNDSGAPDVGRNGGLSHQESRDHNKHNNAGQSGHKPQQHSPAQEKQ
ncbi:MULTISPECIES: hypothetical protein [Microvirga]|uniref:hypothetical protein n=1 Tax=Microvirga TaxID=186650 RepID=UPI001CFFE26B|nr:hypothetical protein [Microvirga lenta]MCB5177677.1 hypothetical protein [Microvirga lenta]